MKNSDSLYEPLKHMQPSIRISPFSPASFSAVLAAQGPDKLTVMENPLFWLNNAKDLNLYDSGRSALLACLHNEGLKRSDEVLIITTTQGKYISSCVTKTIEKVCAWSRRITPATRLAVVIHEFGFPCQSPEIAICRRNGIPIVEDCAYALGSRMEKADVATFGDYAIYSLTKYFPIPFGGVLVSRKKLAGKNPVPVVSLKERALIIRILRRSARLCHQWNRIRQENWKLFSRRLRLPGVHPYFSLSQKTVPGAFVFKLPKKYNPAKRKINLVNAGVECTQYYHMAGFYFPVHPFLTEYEQEYILHYFLKK